MYAIRSYYDVPGEDPREDPGEDPEDGGALMEARTLLQLLQDGGLTVYPLAVASVITLTILFERVWRYRGLESQTRAVTRETIELLVKRNVV